MSDKKQPDVKPAKIETRNLYVPLTEDEVRLRSQEMATAERILAEAEAEEANQATAWTARKKALEKATGDARRSLFELSKARRIEDGAGAEAQA